MGPCLDNRSDKSLESRSKRFLLEAGRMWVVEGKRSYGARTHSPVVTMAVKEGAKVAACACRELADSIFASSDDGCTCREIK